MVNLAHLRWACRRGMLELDVLLGNFLEEAYMTLPEPEQQDFIALLKCEDVELIDWLLGAQLPPDTHLSQIVAKVRQHARSRIPS